MRCVSLLILMTFASTAIAETTVTLPLEGYYRPGKFFPVRVTSDRPIHVEITADNGIGSRGTGEDLTMPVMLLSDNNRSIQLSIDGISRSINVRSLEAQQRLVMIASPDLADGARSLFPDSNLVYVNVPREGVTSLSVAYESVDALLLREQDWAGWLAESSWMSLIRDKLIAFGVTVAVKTASPAEWELAWQKRGDWSVLDSQMRLAVREATDLSFVPESLRRFAAVTAKPGE